jgi:arylsulfatase A-like enzyme
VTGRLTRRGFLGLAGAAGAAVLIDRLRARRLPGGRAPRGAGAFPHILLLVFDTLSARHLSIHGYARPASPNIARWAERARVYHRHYAGGSFTTSGTASLLTGTYPWTHRAMHLYGSLREGLAARNLFHLLAGAYTQTAYTHNPLAYLLLDQCRRAGAELDLVPMHTLLHGAELASHAPNDFAAALNAELQLRRIENDDPSGLLFLGVGEFFYKYARLTSVNNAHLHAYPAGYPRTSHGAFFTLEEAVQWIAGRLTAASAPALAYVHLLPPHEPYLPPRPFLGQFTAAAPPAAKPPHPLAEDPLPPRYLQRARAEYDEYLAYADAAFGSLMDGLETAGILQDTIVILTSDHGQLFERGIHGHVTPVLYEPLIRIPLLIWQPGAARQDIHTPTSAVDILPTLLHLAGQSPPAWAEGEILPGFSAAHTGARAIFVVDAKGSSKFQPLMQATLAIIRGDHKAIQYRGFAGLENAVECYDLAADPEELNPLSPELPEFRELLRALDEAADAADQRLAT